MSFNSSMVKAYASGAVVAMQSPLASISGSSISLNTVTAGSTVSTTGLVLSPGGSQNIEFDSLCAIVQTAVNTSTMTVTTLWQVSEDGTNWITLYPFNAPAYVTVAAAGTGSTVYTQYVQSLNGYNPSFPYLRLAAKVGVATGGASDAVIVAYQWRRRFVAPIG